MAAEGSPATPSRRQADPAAPFAVSQVWSACKRMQVLLERDAMNTSRAHRAAPPPRPRNARWLAMCPETRAWYQLLSTPQPEGCLPMHRSACNVAKRPEQLEAGGCWRLSGTHRSSAPLLLRCPTQIVGDAGAVLSGGRPLPTLRQRGKLWLRGLEQQSQIADTDALHPPASAQFLTHVGVQRRRLLERRARRRLLGGRRPAAGLRLVAVCVLAIAALGCTGSVCSRRQSSRVEPTPRTPAGPTPSRRRRLRRQNEMTTIKLNNEDQHAEIVTLRGTHVEVVLDRSPEGQHRLWWGLAGDRSKRVGSFRVGKPAEPQTALMQLARSILAEALPQYDAGQAIRAPSTSKQGRCAAGQVEHEARGAPASPAVEHVVPMDALAGRSALRRACRGRTARRQSRKCTSAE